MAEDKKTKHATTSSEKVAFVGVGKITHAAVEGLLLSGFSARNITVAGREETNLSKILSLGNINPTVKLVNALHADTLIIAIQPGHLGGFVKDMQRAREEYRSLKHHYPNQNIISFISNESPEKLAEHLDIPKINIIGATLDTNVACGRGTILYTATEAGNHSSSLELLKRIGTPYNQLNYEQVAKGVVTVGAGKAGHLKCLKLWFEGRSNEDLNRSIRRLHTAFSEHTNVTTGFFGFSVEDEAMNFPYKSYLATHARVLAEVLGYDEFEALLLVTKSFVNTIASLAAQKTITFALLDKAITQVATKGGCTEQGLGLLKTASDIEHENLLNLFYSKIWNRTQQFENDILISLGQEDPSSAAVFTGLANGYMLPG